VALPVMPYGEVGSTYVVLARQEGSLALGKFACTLRFTVKEIDPSTGVARPAVCQSSHSRHNIGPVLQFVWLRQVGCTASCLRDEL